MEERVGNRPNEEPCHAGSQERSDGSVRGGIMWYEVITVMRKQREEGGQYALHAQNLRGKDQHRLNKYTGSEKYSFDK